MEELPLLLHILSDMIHIKAKALKCRCVAVCMLTPQIMTQQEVYHARLFR